MDRRDRNAEFFRDLRVCESAVANQPVNAGGAPGLRPVDVAKEVLELTFLRRQLVVHPGATKVHEKLEKSSMPKQNRSPSAPVVSASGRDLAGNELFNLCVGNAPHAGSDSHEAIVRDLLNEIIAVGGGNALLRSTLRD